MVNGFINATVAEHVVAESTNLGGTNYAKHIFNVLAKEDIDNGKLVNLTDAQYIQDKDPATAGFLHNVSKMVENVATVYYEDPFAEGECFTMEEPTVESRVGLVLSVPTFYDESPRRAVNDKYFYNAKGEVMRVYDLMRGDRFTVSELGITAVGTAPAVGNFVVADGYDIKEVEEAPEAAFVGEIIEEINRISGKFYKILVRKNA